MANPEVVSCSADVWTKVATSVTNGMLTFKSGRPSSVYITYRATGEAAPTTTTDAVLINDDQAPISFETAVDLYVQPIGEAASVVMWL